MKRNSVRLTPAEKRFRRENPRNPNRHPPFRSNFSAIIRVSTIRPTFAFTATRKIQSLRRNEGKRRVTPAKSLLSSLSSSRCRLGQLERVSPGLRRRRRSASPSGPGPLLTRPRRSLRRVYDYLIFRTPEGYKSANLESPDYGRGEKYEPVPVAAPAAQGSMAEPGQGMSPDRTFIAPAAAPCPKTKVALGAKKAAAKPTADPPYFTVPDTTPTNASSGGGADPDLQVTLGPSRRGKEKAFKKAESRSHSKAHPNARPAPDPPISTKRAPGEDALASTIVDQIRDKVPGMEGPSWGGPLQTGSASKTPRISFGSKSPQPSKEFRNWKKELAAPRNRAEKAEKKLGEAEARAERRRRPKKEAIRQDEGRQYLARFI
nr:hypothetical protein Iba_chr06cCG16670 [Ipomoea batatas]